MGHQILLGLVDLESSCYFTREQYLSTRGDRFRLAKPAVVSVRDKTFINNRVISKWNSSPDSIISVSSISSFEGNVNAFDFSNFLSL